MFGWFRASQTGQCELSKGDCLHLCLFCLFLFVKQNRLEGDEDRLVGQ